MIPYHWLSLSYILIYSSVTRISTAVTCDCEAIPTIQYNGKCYATISGADPNGMSVGCENGQWYTLPDGWQIADAGTDTTYISTNYPWSTYILLFGYPNQSHLRHETWEDTTLNDGLWDLWEVVSGWSVQFQAANQYKAGSCSLRVLISKPAECEEPTPMPTTKAPTTKAPTEVPTILKTPDPNCDNGYLVGSGGVGSRCFRKDCPVYGGAGCRGDCCWGNVGRTGPNCNDDGPPTRSCVFGWVPPQSALSINMQSDGILDDEAKTGDILDEMTENGSSYKSGWLSSYFVIICITLITNILAFFCVYSFCIKNKINPTVKTGQYIYDEVEKQEDAQFIHQ